MSTDKILRPSSGVSFDELCQSVSLSSEVLLEFIELEIAEPLGGGEPREWHFSVTTVARVRRATRMQHDLGMSLEDIGLVLDLLDEVEQLRSENTGLKQQLGRLLGQQEWS